MAHGENGRTGAAIGGVPRRAAARLLATVLAALCAAGFSCEPARYRLELRMQGDALERTLVRIPQKDPSERDQARWATLSKLYGAPVAEQTLRRVSRGALAPEFGGGGAWQLRANPLGKVFAYRERLEGKDDLAALHERLDAGVAQSRELTEGWIAGELGAQHPAAPVLDAFLRERLIPDLRSLALYRWLGASELVSPAEAEQRMAQFLVERDYLPPEAARSLSDDATWRAMLRRELVRAGLPLDAKLEGELAFLLGDDGPALSLGVHLSRSPAFREWLREHSAPGAAAAPAALEPGDLEELAHGLDSPGAERAGKCLEAYAKQRYAAAWELLIWAVAEPEAMNWGVVDGFGADRIDVSLALPDAPFETNGHWDAAARRLEWRDRPLHASAALPAFLYARWSEPDRAFQQARFGRVLLRGRELASYSDWYADQLSDAQRSAWDAFLAEWRPGKGALQRLRAFRFADDTDQRSSDGKRFASQAAPAIELLKAALEAKPAPGRASPRAPSR